MRTLLGGHKDSHFKDDLFQKFTGETGRKRKQCPTQQDEVFSYDKRLRYSTSQGEVEDEEEDQEEGDQEECEEMEEGIVHAEHGSKPVGDDTSGLPENKFTDAT